MRAATTRSVASALLLAALWPPPGGHAMDLPQMKSLAGASLLDLRVDAVFEQCGLPSAMGDTADDSHERQMLHWKQAEMRLSPKNWTIHYSRRPPAVSASAGWRNTTSPKATCLSGLSSLVLDARGEAGILSVRKRDDNRGYITTYAVPENLYHAHQIVGAAATWERGRPESEIAKAFGAPSEIVKRDGDVSIHRYWVVGREGQMPLALYAVDFEVSDAKKTSRRYAAYSSGVGFVQEKLDALVREWEKAYVID